MRRAAHEGDRLRLLAEHAAQNAFPVPIPKAVGIGAPVFVPQQTVDCGVDRIRERAALCGARLAEFLQKRGGFGKCEHGETVEVRHRAVAGGVHCRPVEHIPGEHLKQPVAVDVFSDAFEIFTQERHEFFCALSIARIAVIFAD